MDGGGFEPPKQYAADLQSVPFGHSGIHPNCTLVVLLGITIFLVSLRNNESYYNTTSTCCQADRGTRTLNLLITNQLLCQLSHIGIFFPFQPIALFELNSPCSLRSQVGFLTRLSKPRQVFNASHIGTFNQFALQTG